MTFVCVEDGNGRKIDLNVTNTYFTTTSSNRSELRVEIAGLWEEELFLIVEVIHGTERSRISKCMGLAMWCSSYSNSFCADSTIKGSGTYFSTFTTEEMIPNSPVTKSSKFMLLQVVNNRELASYCNLNFCLLAPKKIGIHYTEQCLIYSMLLLIIL